MTYEQIEAFLGIVNYGTISSAASNLFLSQSTISTRLAQLEEELETPLIIRGKGHRNVSLTQSGSAFIPIAHQWAALYKDTYSIKDNSGISTIRIASVDAVNNYTFVPLFSEHIEKHPEIRLDIRTHHSNEIHNLIWNRQADIGFVFSQISYPDIISTPVYRELMYLVFHRSSGYRDGISCTDLNRSHEVFLSWGPDYRRWHDAHFTPAELPLITVNTGSMLQRYLTEPGRWAIAPMSVIRGAMRSNPDLDFCKLNESPDPRICYMLTNRIPPINLSEAIDAFCTEMRDYISRDSNICSFEDWMLQD